MTLTLKVHFPGNTCVTFTFQARLQHYLLGTLAEGLHALYTLTELKCRQSCRRPLTAGAQIQMR